MTRTLLSGPRRAICRITRLSSVLVMTCWCACVYALETLAAPPFVILYPDSDPALAQRSLDSLQAITFDLDHHLPVGDAPITVVICGTIEDFRRYAGSYGRYGVGGVAQSQEGVIVVRAPAISQGNADFAGTLRHELVHVLLARNVDLVNVPRWLNEGLAMHLSGEYRWSTSFTVAKMYLQEQIIPLRNLNFAFAAPRSDWEFSNAYAEAHSLTKFLHDKLGDEDFWRLVAALKVEHFEDALPWYSMWTPDSLFDAWERSLWKVALVSSTVSGLTIFQLAALLTVLAYWRRSRRARATLRQWEDEEEFESPWYDPPSEVYWEPESDDDHP